MAQQRRTEGTLVRRLLLPDIRYMGAPHREVYERSLRLAIEILDLGSFQCGLIGGACMKALGLAASLKRIF